MLTTEGAASRLLTWRTGVVGAMLTAQGRRGQGAVLQARVDVQGRGRGA